MAPRQLIYETTLDEHEDEIDYTRAALEADGDTASLVASTDGWQPMVDAARAKIRAARRAETGADAKRRVSNGALDAGCMRMAKELSVEVDPGQPRWARFFGNKAPSRFVRQAFESQVSAVEAWLAVEGDPVLERLRPVLAPAVSAARAALTATAAIAVPIGEARIARAQLAENMTRERDGLFNELDALGRRLGKPRDYATLFFRATSRTEAEPESSDKPSTS